MEDKCDQQQILQNEKKVYDLKEIKSGQEIVAEAEHMDRQFYYFDIGEKPSYIKIECLPNNAQSDADLYITPIPLSELSYCKKQFSKSQLEDMVNYKTCLWKANQYGLKRIDIINTDKNYKSNSRYFICVEPYRKNINNFTMKLVVKEAKHINQCENQIIYNDLYLDGDSKFFKYDIKNELGSSFIVFEVSRKKDLQIFISSKSQYPDKDENFRWAFGDLNENFITTLKKNASMRDLFTQMSPYKFIFPDNDQNKFGSSKLTYVGEFKNILENQNRLILFEGLPLENKSVYRYYFAVQQDDIKYKDNLLVYLDTQYWKYFGNQVYIGVYQKPDSKIDPELINFSLKISEVLKYDLLPKQIKIKYDVYHQVYTEYNPQNVSQADRAKLEIHKTDKLEFTYGEVIFEHFLPLLKLVNPKKGEIFWDIGCGGARPVVIAALNFPQLKCCKGIEYLPNLAELAKNAVQLMSDLAKTIDEGEQLEIAPAEIQQGDLLKNDWQLEADIVYSSSVCFPQDLNDGIANLCRQLKPGARLISLKSFDFDVSSFLKYEFTVKMTMTWGQQSAIIYTKI